MTTINEATPAYTELAHTRRHGFKWKETIFFNATISFGGIISTKWPIYRASRQYRLWVASSERLTMMILWRWAVGDYHYRVSSQKLASLLLTSGLIEYIDMPGISRRDLPLIISIFSQKVRYRLYIIIIKWYQIIQTLSMLNFKRLCMMNSEYWRSYKAQLRVHL